MHVFKEIDKSSTVIKSNLTNFTQNLTTSSIGIQSIKIVSGSINNNYWQSLNVLFYTSGSPMYPNENKFEKPANNFSLVKSNNSQFLTKYHGYPSSSIIQIPSKYYGEEIKRGSFQIVDLMINLGIYILLMHITHKVIQTLHHLIIMLVIYFMIRV